MFADTISSIVSDANEENIETWKERDAFISWLKNYRKAETKV